MEGTTTATVSMATIVSAVGEAFTAVTGWAGDIGTMIVSTPLLLFAVVLGFVGVGVTMFKRLLSV